MGLTLNRIAIALMVLTLGRVALNGLMMGSVWTVVMGALAAAAFAANWPIELSRPLRIAAFAIQILTILAMAAAGLRSAQRKAMTVKTIVAGVCLIAAAALWAMAESPRDQITDASFLFDSVKYSSPVLGGDLTADDLATIEKVARAELAAAFQGLRIAITDRRETRYHVRVVQELDDSPLTRPTWVAGSSHAVPGFGGSGAVNFTYFASGALVFAPPQASRAELIEAIGRGLGRGAAHEFAHQFLGAAIHATSDRGSYEYHAASRPQQYYGPMHWDVAGPMLTKRFGR